MTKITHGISREVLQKGVYSHPYFKKTCLWSNL